MLGSMGDARASAELVLGTAQLGLAYGAANRTGQPSDNEARMLLRAAVSAGVRWIDTAAAYGSSEQRIGAALPGSLRVRIATKLSPLSELPQDATAGAVRQAVSDSIRRSCTRLKTDRLEVLMLHRAEHLTAMNGAIWNTVKEFRDEGALYDLGVSVYSPEEALQAIADRDVRHIQLPFNVLDWRWRESGVIEALAKRPGVTVHARSAFLQGLLAAGTSASWPAIEGIDPQDLVHRLASLARELGRDSIADLCLAYVRAQTWIDGVVVGMENLQQLALNLALFKRPALSGAEIMRIDAALPHASERLLNPALWAKAA
jgi:aryl-alcohol dehydrogenase-like predicted oxidoreductase